MTKPDAIDQSWGFASPEEAVRRGIKLVMMYLSPDPSKNATLAKILAYLKVGIGIVFGWESTASRALQGASAGTYDGREAARQLRALIDALPARFKPSADYRVTIYFAVDFDTNSSQYSALDAYLTAAGKEVHAAGFRLGVYAEADYVEHTAKRRITDSEWQTYAWSAGRLADATDFYQFLNGQTLGGASVDFDKIIHEHQVGALWPKSNDNPTTPKEDDTVTMTKKELDSLVEQIAKATAEEVLNTQVTAHDGTRRSVKWFIASARTHALHADQQTDDKKG